MIAKARRSAALVTGAKFSRSARITALPVTAVHVLVTDQIDASLKTEFISHGLDVIEAGYLPARRARSA
jgi:DeoR/GlpR family transcriptional regulator of sugar metabolism